MSLQTIWQEDAACANYPNSDLWFPIIIDDDGKEWIDDGTIWEAFGDTSEYYNEAREICGLCPVKSECLAQALERKERYGMWGQTTPIERLRIERRQRRARLKLRRANENNGTIDILE